MNLAKINFKKVGFIQNTIDDYASLLCFLLEYMLDKMMLPGQVENWMVLSDLGKMGLGNISISSLKQVLSMLQINYKGRLGNNFIINPPKSLWILWSGIKPFLDEMTIEKIKISKTSTSQDMLGMFNPNQVEEKYGGKAKNLINYWPPTVPDSGFNIEGKASLLSEKDSYYDVNPREVYENKEELHDEKIKTIYINDHESPLISRGNSLEILPMERYESDLLAVQEPCARSEKDDQEVLEDFEEAMPFDKNMQRNPGFIEFGKRSSGEFQRMITLKAIQNHGLDLETNNEIEKKNSFHIESSEENTWTCTAIGCGFKICILF
jgi:CRAL/TRIO domain